MFELSTDVMATSLRHLVTTFFSSDSITETWFFCLFVLLVGIGTLRSLLESTSLPDIMIMLYTLCCWVCGVLHIYSVLVCSFGVSGSFSGVRYGLIPRTA